MEVVEVRIGAHVGVAGGHSAAVEYAQSVGCECVQVFAKSPRQWIGKPLDPAACDAFRVRARELGIGPIMVHSAYLINLGSDDPGLWDRSWRALADELTRAASLGADAVITHLGTRSKRDPGATPGRMAEAIERAFAEADAAGTRLLLENTAGAGSTYGSGPGELGAVLHALGALEGRVGVCLDTCHAHAAGWDLSSPRTWVGLLDDFERCCGRPVAAIHANDCLFPSGEHRDRHAWIGEGTIGEAGFAEMFRQDRLAGVPVIIEMPGEVPVKDAENITRLKRLRDACGGLSSFAG